MSSFHRSGFTVHHHVTAKETDDQFTVLMAKEAQQSFPAMNQTSYDKGFWSSANLAEMETCQERALLPRKGCLSATDKARAKPSHLLQIFSFFKFKKNQVSLKKPANFFLSEPVVSSCGL